MSKANGRAAAVDDHEQDRRRTILRAAIEVFAKKGYHGCRIADVAREAKVAYGLVYHYFQNKDELLRSVFETSWGGFLTRLGGLLEKEAQAPIDEKVRRIVELCFDAYRKDGRAVKVLILEIARSPAGGKVNRTGAFADVIRPLAQMFVDAKKRGEMRADADPLLTAVLLFGTIEIALTSFVVGLLDKGDPQALESASAQVVEMFLRGVLPAGRPRRVEGRAQRA